MCHQSVRLRESRPTQERIKTTFVMAERLVVRYPVIAMDSTGCSTQQFSLLGATPMLTRALSVHCGPVPPTAGIQSVMTEVPHASRNPARNWAELGMPPSPGIQACNPREFRLQKAVGRFPGLCRERAHAGHASCWRASAGKGRVWNRDGPRKLAQAGSALISRRFLASRPHTTPTRWTGSPRSRYLSA